MCPRGSEPHSPMTDDSTLKKMWAREQVSVAVSRGVTQLHLTMQTAHCAEPHLAQYAISCPQQCQTSVPHKDPASTCFKNETKHQPTFRVIRKYHTLWKGNPTVNYIMICGFL